MGVRWVCCKILDVHGELASSQYASSPPRERCGPYSLVCPSLNAFLSVSAVYALLVNLRTGTDNDIDFPLAVLARSFAQRTEDKRTIVGQGAP